MLRKFLIAYPGNWGVCLPRGSYSCTDCNPICPLSTAPPLLRDFSPLPTPTASPSACRLWTAAPPALSSPWSKPRHSSGLLRDTCCKVCLHTVYVQHRKANGKTAPPLPACSKSLLVLGSSQQWKKGDSITYYRDTPLPLTPTLAPPHPCNGWWEIWPPGTSEASFHIDPVSVSSLVFLEHPRHKDTSALADTSLILVGLQTSSPIPFRLC